MKKVFYLMLTLIAVTVIVALLPCKPCERPVTQSASIVIDLPKSQAWNYLQDFSIPHHYVPNLAKTEILSELETGQGAHRRVYNEDGTSIEETIVEWMPGDGFVLDLHQGAEVMSPFSFAQFRYLLESEGSDRCRINVSMSTKLPMGYLGLALQKLAIDPVVAENLKGVAAGMKLYYETGKPAVPHQREALKEQVRLDP